MYIEPSDLWDVAHDEAYSQRETYPEDCSQGAAFSYGAEWGAGWMAAIIGMGQAIRESYDDLRICQHGIEHLYCDDCNETWQDRSVRLAGR